PRALEWELRSGALTSWRGVVMIHYNQEKRARETGPALIATPVSFVRKMEFFGRSQKGVALIPPRQTKRSISQMRRSNFTVRPFRVEFDSSSRLLPPT